MQSLSCPTKHCPPSGKGDVGAIIRHGFYTTRWGKRRRYQCQTCGKTFCSTTGTPYYRLQHRRSTFDEVTSLSVAGVNSDRPPELLRAGLTLANNFTSKKKKCMGGSPGLDQ
jgi:hypothetical protein